MECLNVQIKLYPKNFYGQHWQSVAKFQFVFEVSKQCQRISAFLVFFSRKVAYERRVMKWHYAAVVRAVTFLTFYIDVSNFTYLDTVQLL